MEGRGRELAQLAVQQELRAAYGIKTKKGKPLRSAVGGAAKGKIFGIPLHELPLQNVPEYGNIPCFLVEVCKYLEKHMHTEGLFRKSGSVVRMKALKSKLDQGETSLSTAQPCDVAGLLKQFFRELPEPILPTNLQDALIKAQQLNSEERISATLLLSCLINDKAVDTLRYIFKFLKNVSLRSEENKMDSNNLAVIFAPNLLQSSELDKMTTHAEKKLRLQASILQTFIDQADKIGLLPKPILEKIPAMLGIDDSSSTPSLQDHGENEIQTPGEHMRKRRQSIGDVVSGALNKFKSNRTPSTTPQRDTCAFAPVTPVIVTPSSKRKYPADSSQGFSSKKRRSIRHNMGLELLPNSLFSLSSTPGSVQFESSPTSLEVSQNSLSISVSGENHLLNIGSRRSKRIASKKVQRADSGKMGCFSPKISRKEMVRRSLRLKFILGRSSKECEKNSGKEHSASNRSQNIGRRLASQQDMESGFASVKTSALFSPYVGPKNSKSEENLKIVKSNEASYRMSWTGPSSTESQETCSRGNTSMTRCDTESVLATRELPVIPFKTVAARTEQDGNTQQTSFYEDENNMTADTLLKIKKAFSQSGSNLHNLLEAETSKSNSTVGKMHPTGHNLERDQFKTTAQKMSNVEQTTTFTNSANESSGIDKFLSSTDEINSVERPLSPNSAEMDRTAHGLHKNEDQLIARTSLQTQLNSTSTLQKEILESTKQFSTEGVTEVEEPIYCKLETETGRCLESKELLSLLPEDGDSKRSLHLDACEKSKPSPLGKVADHIHWFNKLSLNEPCSATKTKPPLNFQRTPVRHSIRKMNSLLEADKKTVTCKLIKAGDDCSSLVRSVSYETALSCEESMSKTSSATSLPSVPTFKQMSACDHLARSSKSFQQLEKVSRDDTNCKEAVATANHPKSALEDLTNHEAPKIVLKVNASMRVSGATPDKCALRKTEIKARYRGSPKNPIAASKLLPVLKPLDL